MIPIIANIIISALYYTACVLSTCGILNASLVEFETATGGFFMSQMPYTHESQRDEHNKDSNTKRVMLYGWDANGLQAVRISVDADGNIIPNDFLTNTVKTDSGNTYIGEEKKSGEWRFKKITSTNDFTYATVANNPTMTSYALAYASYTTLNYGDPTEI